MSHSNYKVDPRVILISIQKHCTICMWYNRPNAICYTALNEEERELTLGRNRGFQVTASRLTHCKLLGARSLYKPGKTK